MFAIVCKSKPNSRFIVLIGEAFIMMSDDLDVTGIETKSARVLIKKLWRILF